MKIEKKRRINKVHHFDKYILNSFVFSVFKTNVSIEQESALFLILSTLYFSPIFHIFEKRAKNLILNILVSFLSFVSNSLFILQKKTYEKSNTLLFCSYNIIIFLFNQFKLKIELGKSKIFHFSRLIRNFNSFSLDLSLLKKYLLWPKNIWKYLRFIFDRKLPFCYYIWLYPNKALLTIKRIKMLGNSSKGLLFYHKRLLYKTCIFTNYAL